ncbi:MAG: SusC/RagA family TonB-linked outer membrane protein [Bacteroidetes bacterium]|nr:MAG: SusC/RagA family TonB-linked outer membrane protein [Bacteroidota bacterium]
MKKLVLALLVSVSYLCTLHAQRTLSGTVTGDDGTPLIGATIKIKGSTAGVITDVEGAFNFYLPAGAESLIVSYIGYQTREVPIGDQSRLSIVLKRSTQSLGEVVVTGYSEVEAKKLISSVSVVNGVALDNTSLTDPNQMLQGRAAGLFTTATSGMPGAEGAVRIRGTGTLHAGANPLYVVDGIIVQTGNLTAIGEDYREPDACCTSDPEIMAQINAADIDNITVLKDASATALYGSRGSNGVIVISTKRGAAGKTSVNLNLQSGVTMPNFGNFELMNAEEQWNYERKVYEYSGYSQAEIDQLRPASMLDNTTDWLHEAFVNGRTHQVDLQVRGGNEKTRFFTSGGYFYKDGTLIATDFERYSLLANVDHSISDRVDLSLNLNTSYTHRHNAYTGNSWESPMLQWYRNTPMQGKINPATGELYTGTEDDWIGQVSDNFLYSSQKNSFTVSQFRLLNKLSLRVKLLDNLVFTQSANMDLINGDENKFYDPTTGVGSWFNGGLSHDYNQNIAFTNQSKLKYYTDFGPDHSFDILGVFEYQRVHWKGFGADAWDLLSPYTQTGALAGSFNANRDYKSDYAFLSYLGLANYAFKERYMLTASLRRDGSSRFSTNDRWANFWSLGASWRIAEEAFLQHTKWLNDLRLRASYGTSGNAAIGNFNNQSRYIAVPGYQGGLAIGLQELGDENLTWELSKSLNVGLDFSILDNRVGGTVEYYKRRSENVFLEGPVSFTSGGDRAKQNLAAIGNSGVEFSLNLTPFKAKKAGGFNWSLEFNIAFNDNKILQMPNHRVDSFNLGIYREGSPVRVMPLAANFIGINPDNGEMQFLQKDGSITNNLMAADRYIEFSPHPDFIAGLNSVFSFKGFTLTALFYTAQGQTYDIGVFRSLDSYGNELGGVHLKAAGDYWEKPGDLATRPKPKVGGYPGVNTHLSRSYLFVDASFIRLRNIQLSYALPASMLTKARLQKMVVFVKGENLWTITNYPGMDPEGVEWGRDNWRYPAGKSLVFGVNTTF